MGSLLKDRIDLEPVLLILLFPFVPDPIQLGSVGKSNPTGTLLKKGSLKSYFIRKASFSNQTRIEALWADSRYTERPS